MTCKSLSRANIPFSECRAFFSEKSLYTIIGGKHKEIIHFPQNAVYSQGKQQKIALRRKMTRYA